MPKKTATPMARRISEPAPVESTKGTTPMVKASEVIKNRTQTQAAGVEYRVDAIHAFVKLFFAGELHDQDGVFARETDEHNQTDLSEDVVVAVEQPDSGDSGEQRHRHDENDDQRQRPAFVLRGEHQVHEENGQRKNVDHGVAGQNFLVSQLGPFVLHADG